MKKFQVFVCVFIAIVVIYACNSENEADQKRSKISSIYAGVMKRIKLRKELVVSVEDSSNVFDTGSFNPFTDSIQDLLNTLRRDWERDSISLSRRKLGDSMTHSIDSAVSLALVQSDSLPMMSEPASLRFNLIQFRRLDSLRKVIPNSSCRRDSCRIWLLIDKKVQRLYLHIDGIAVDTFKVSTGDTKHETPLFDMRMSGPIFYKYTSKKFPGGNYKGLGNMPYAVFIKGGFAIHGTTQGNFSKLGQKASHGCIRLHPDNAEIVNELVRMVGLSQTWITIVDGM